MKRNIIYILIITLIIIGMILVSYYIDHKGVNIKTSTLYQTNNFSWYEYNISYIHSDTNPTIIERYRYEWQNKSHNGNILPHYMEMTIQISDKGVNHTFISDVYWNENSNMMIHIKQEYLIDNITVNTSSDSSMYAIQYQKYIPGLPSNSNIISKGVEYVKINNKTYEANKYFLPSHIENGEMIVDNISYWFTHNIPVPIKIYYANDNTTYELVGWG